MCSIGVGPPLDWTGWAGLCIPLRNGTRGGGYTDVCMHSTAQGDGIYFYLERNVGIDYVFPCMVRIRSAKLIRNSHMSAFHQQNAEHPARVVWLIVLDFLSGQKMASYHRFHLSFPSPCTFVLLQLPPFIDMLVLSSFTSISPSSTLIPFK
jgi:hypothetical protein